MALAMLATRDTPLPPSRVEVIATRSSGNPQYLRDLLLAAAMGDDDSLPDSVEAAAVASIDRLAVADRALVRRAALFGSSFHPDHLEIVRSEGVSVPDEWTWARLSAFFEAEVDGYWRFRREVVRDAAYEGLPFRVRRELHSMIARWIEQEAGDDTLERAESLSLHFHRAGLPEPAWRYSLMSGDRSVDRYAPYDAARFYQRAIEVARSLHPDASELIEVFEKLGDAFDRSGQFARAHDAFDSARRHVGDEPMAQARLFERHSHVSERAGHFVSAVRWARRGLRAIEDEQGRDALAQRARLVASLATIRMRQRRLRDAEVLAREAIDVAEIADERRAFARACQTLEVALVESGRPTDGRYARRALEAFEELGDLFGQSAVLNNMGGVAYWEGRWAEAVELYERAADASTRAGMSVDSAFGDFNVGEILIDQGHVAEGEERVRRAEQVWRGTQDEHGVAFAEALLARAALRAGRLEEARDLYRVAIDGHRRLRAEGDAHVAEVELLELLVAGGQPETALEQADLIAASGSTDLVTFVVPQLERARGLALARLGELEAAVAALRASLDEAEARGSDFEVARTLDCLLIILPEDEQAAEWRARRDVIFERLGVVRSAIAAIATSFGDPRPAAAR
jgi:tetratricopeptide (TPR) repeat protein